MLLAAFPVEEITFMVAGAICIAGALGVVMFRNTVHNALSLVATLFGIAVLFIAQEAYFLAAVQIIVYAGAIVVLFLFVIMLLGVDKVQVKASECNPLTLAIAGCIGGAIVTMSMVAALYGSSGATGATSVTGALDAENDLNAIAEALFTDYIFAFEITSLLLTIAVVGAVVLARKAKGPVIDPDEFPPPVTDGEDELPLENLRDDDDAADGSLDSPASEEASTDVA